MTPFYVVMSIGTVTLAVGLVRIAFGAYVTLDSTIDLAADERGGSKFMLDFHKTEAVGAIRNLKHGALTIAVALVIFGLAPLACPCAVCPTATTKVTP